MKIVYLVTRSDAVGGATVHVRDLARALQALGNQVTVLIGGEGPVSDELRALGIPYHSLYWLARPIRPAHDVLAVREVRKLLEVLQPHILSAHSSKAGWVGRVAGRSLGIPTLFTAHGWAFTDGVPARRRWPSILAEKLAGPLACRIITVSDHDRELALRYRLAPPEKVVTVHNGMPDVLPTLRANPGAHRPRLTMVARFDAPKDHGLLLDALAGLRELEWGIDFIGDGPLQAAVRARVSELGLDRRVRFLGDRRDVAELLAQVQGFVLATNWEGFPRSILEAMRAGLPVIASDVGGIREAVVDGESGFLVPRGDALVLRDRIKCLLSDPVLRRRMGGAGRKHYEAAFTFERMLQETLSVYNDFLRESNPSGDNQARLTHFTERLG